MRISAIVLNWRDNPRTMRCVGSLVAAGSVEHIFVVDNESEGGLRSLLDDLAQSSSACWTLIELAENRGFAGGVNVALQASLDQGFDAILVINNDAVIDPQSVLGLAASLEEDPALGMVGPRIIQPDGREESAGGYFNRIRGTTSHSSRSGSAPDFITWACILVRSDALQAVGLLDERYFMYWEDVDFSCRLREAGWGFRICADAVATHELSANRKSHPVAIKAYHTWSSVIFAQKHRGVWRFGNVIWILTSALANLARVRIGALRGLRLGLRLSREGSAPAYLSVLRVREFGRS